MKLRLAGCGWVTPLGNSLAGVWEKLRVGESATAQPFADSLGKKIYRAFRVPLESVADAVKNPRLRRASAISRFAVSAGLSALRDAGVTLDPAAAERTALIFAISNGGVIYTKRFYHDIVQSGAQAASPLLFPETVFNAPASHLAALLGLTGATYTLVGDGAVGLLALHRAENLLGDPALDRCLIVGAEEVDALICDAYYRWRMLRAEPPLEIFQPRARGTILSEGAGAILLAREGEIALEKTHPGGNYFRRRELVRLLDSVCGEMKKDFAPDFIVASANGTFIDRAEAEIFTREFPAAEIYSLKSSLGEGFAAGAIWQVIAAAQALRAGKLPRNINAPPGFCLTNAEREPAERALVVSCGLNQQVAAVGLSRERTR